MDENNIILEVKGLKQYFPIYQGLLQRVVGYVKSVGSSPTLRINSATIASASLPLATP